MSRLGWADCGGAWVWRRRLLAWEEESVRGRSILLYNVVLHDQTHDTWKWLLDPIHGYSMRDAYRFFTTTGVVVVRNLTGDIWHNNIPSKVSLFVWPLLRNRLQTKDNLSRRSILPTTDLACTADCGTS